MSAAAFVIPPAILFSWFAVKAAPEVKKWSVFESVAPCKFFYIRFKVSSPPGTGVALWEPRSESWVLQTHVSKFVAELNTPLS